MIPIRMLRLLFCFKKPEFIHFSYIHVLIKNKPTLFIVWEIKNVLRVRLIPLKRSSFAAKNTLIIAVSKDLEHVTLSAANCWRKTRIELEMHAVELDDAAAAQLIKGFRPLNKLDVKAPFISAIRNRVKIKPVSIRQRSIVIKKTDRFNINIQPLNYP